MIIGGDNQIPLLRSTVVTNFALNRNLIRSIFLNYLDSQGYDQIMTGPAFFRHTRDVPRKIRPAPSLVDPWDIDPITTKMFEI